MVNTHIGELAMHTGGKDFIFRPLFCRVAELGSPKEILELLEDVQRPNKEGFRAAIQILNVFADEDPFEAIGYFGGDNGKVIYTAGYCPMQDIHVIGCKIMQDALLGRPTGRDKDKAKSGRPSIEFDPADFVAIGDAHLSGRDWWKATMIELQKAIKAKAPEKEDEITSDDITAMYAVLDERKNINGN